MKRTLISILLSALFLGGGAALLMASLQMRKPSPKSQDIDTSVAVEAKKMHRQDYTETIVAYGWAKALHKTTIAAQIAGTISEISPQLRIGENVAEKTVLVRLDNRQQKNLLKEAEAHLAESQALLKVLHIDIANLGKEIAMMKKEIAVSQREVQRYEKLQSQTDITASRLDDQLIQHSTRNRAYLKLQWQRKQKQLEIDRVSAQIAAREAKVSFTQQELDKTTIHAPYSGQILKRHANVGAWVSPGTPLLEIFDLQKIAVELAIPASHFHKDMADSKVVLRLREEGAVVWQGKMSRISETIDERRNFLGFVDIADRSILAGSFVIAEVSGKTYQKVFVVPRLALEGDKVFVIERTNGDRAVVKEVTVTITALVGEVALVEKGLADNAEIVVAGIEKIGDGSRVVVVSSDKLPTRKSQKR